MDEVRNGPALRRLLDLPGVAALEQRAKAEWGAAAPATADQLCRDLFGLGAVDLHTSPADPPEGAEYPLDTQVARFRELGWDVTDHDGRPLKVLRWLGQPLLTVCLGLGGRLPETPDVESWSAAMQEAATSFFKQRRGPVVVMRRKSGRVVRPPAELRKRTP